MNADWTAAGATAGSGWWPQVASAGNAVVTIRVPLGKCIDGHGKYHGDYVAVGGDCGRDACLAESAPCDATLRCGSDGACGAHGLCPPADLGLGAPPWAAPDSCHEVETCNPATGLCSSPEAVPPGTSCDDGNACNGPDTCNLDGVCTHGAPPDCGDGSPCTNDVCLVALGCAHTLVADDTACGEGDACTVASCQGGSCVGVPNQLR